jgi:anti-anti-sigma factor
MRLADVDFSTHGKSLVADLSGEIDISNADQLCSLLTDATGNDLVALILDLTAVDYLDSAGIRLIYRLQERLNGRGQAFRLVIPDASVIRRALLLAGVLGHVEILETVDDALGGVEPLSA